MTPAMLHWVFVVFPALIVPLVALIYRVRLDLKRQEVKALLDRGGLSESYLESRRLVVADEVTSERVVAHLFDPIYSKRFYWFPLSMCFLLVLAGCTVVILRMEAQLGLPAETQELLKGISWAAVAGFAGGYLWSLNDVIYRYRCTDLPPSALDTVWLRIAIASVAGLLVATVVKEEFAVLVAFAIGAFPLKTIRDLLRSISRKQLDFASEPTPAEKPNLHLLQGLSAEVIARLEEEGITRAQHLANADPLKLCLTTNIPWSVIVDIIDQAMLFNYVEDKLPALRRVGVRSAIEMANIHQCIHQEEDAKARKMAEDMVAEIRKCLEIDMPGVIYILDTIAGDGQVNFLWSLWEKSLKSG